MPDRSGRDLLDERMDQRLREYGARWQAGLPAPAERARASVPRRRWLVPVAAAAAVTAVVGVTFAVTTGDRDDGIAPSEEPTSTAPSDTTGAALPCGPDDLIARKRRLEGAAGTTYLTTSLMLNSGAAACTVEGYPEVVLMDHGSVAGVETVHDGPASPGSLTVSSGKPVVVVIAWSLSHHCRDIDNDAILLRAGDDAEVEIEGFGQTSCSPGEGEQAVRVRPLLQVDGQMQGEVEVGVNTGTVSGTVTIVGGPAPGTSYEVTVGTVRFFDDADEEYEADIRPDGTYEIELPAGRYQVVVASDQWSASNAFDHGAFDVAGGTTNPLDITMPIE